MNSETTVSFRHGVYALLIVAAVGGLAGRITGVARVYEPWLTRPADADPEVDKRGSWPAARPEPWPTHGDNDRSRWATVRALVEEEGNWTYAIGHRTDDRDPVTGKPVDRGIVTQDGWKTIDKVLHPDTKDFYSSKPPLLPTLAAGEYWALRQGLGWEMTHERQRWLVVPAILLTFNALPWAVFLLLLARLAEDYAATDWAKVYVVAAACFGTYLTAFGTTFNNHTVAACAVMFALVPAVRIWGTDRAAGAPAWLYTVAGFFASFAACTELPAASFAGLLFLLLLWHSPGKTLLAFVPAALIPAAGFFLTNYAAIGRFVPAYGEFGGPWYEYEGSHWKLDPNKPMSGIDAAGMQESRAVYAFHLLLGHHGVFLLTPIFLVALAGMALGLRGRYPGPAPDEGAAPEPRRDGMRMAALLTVAVTAVVLGFYILYLDDRKRNYGGWTTGPRWLIWLTPLWLFAMLPAADWLGRRRWGRWLAYALLAVSAFSVSYPAWNPWRHPWVYNLMEALGWVKY